MGEAEARTSSRLSRIDFMLLGMLGQCSMHGYEVVDVLSQPNMSLWASVGKTSVYKSLARLEKAGRVSSHLERVGGKPERTVYSITSEGRDVFFETIEHGLGEVKAGTTHFDVFDVALFYANQIEPEAAVSRIADRIETLCAQIDRLAVAVQSARKSGEIPEVLVLEHRLRLVKTEMESLVSLGEALYTGEGLGANALLSGDLDNVVLHHVLRNLEAAERSGTLRVHTEDAEIEFCFESGRLGSFVPPEGLDAESSLKVAFQSRSGTFQFLQSVCTCEGAVPLAGVTSTILLGCRGTTDSELLRELMPDMGTLLDTVGNGRSWADASLVAHEELLLDTIDGVRTVAEVAEILEWNSREVLSVAYPLWACGWIARVGSHKRDFVEAMALYLQAWEEAADVVSSSREVRALKGEVRVAAERGGLTARWSLGSPEAGTHFSGDIVTLGDDARRFAVVLRREISSRFGQGFVESVCRSLGKRLPAHSIELLREHGVMGRR